MTRVCIGGTFNILHKGHKSLINKAFETGDYVLIGLTSDKMANAGRKGKARSYEYRKNALKQYMKERKFKNKCEIVKIDDRYGPATKSDFDAIVVSQETRFIAEEINAVRLRKKLKSLKIHEIDLVLADDGTPIKGSRILKGEMTVDGKILRKTTIAVGSTNNVKINAAKNVFSKIYKDISVKPVNIGIEIPEQPFEKDVVSGAILRARTALEKAKSDFGIGIESGLFWNRDTENYYDVQYCAVIDKMGSITIGHGPGFQHPREVMSRIKKGETTGSAMEKLYGIKDIGKKMGAIGYLSNGLIDRTKLTEQAIIMAMVPRIKKELY
ncbi:MAG: inosine/xanthosine triphosphatase [Thermoplasmata archaeon]